MKEVILNTLTGLVILLVFISIIVLLKSIIDSISPVIFATLFILIIIAGLSYILGRAFRE